MSIWEEIEREHELRWKEAEARAHKILYGDAPTPEEKKERPVPSPEEVAKQTVEEALNPQPDDPVMDGYADPSLDDGYSSMTNFFDGYYQRKGTRSKGFTPEERALFCARLKAEGFTTMTPEGEIDRPKRSGHRNTRGVFRRS